MTATPPSPVGLRNDEIRQNGLFGPGYNSPLMITPGVRELGQVAIEQLILKFMQFDDWNTGNDPYGDRDFGILVQDGTKVMFQIERSREDEQERLIILTTPSER